jgi:hypothetical protein
MPPSPAGTAVHEEPPTPHHVLVSLINDLASPDPRVELASALLFQTEQVAFTWPAFASLRSAARASKRARALFLLAVSALVSEARLVFGACFHLSRGTLIPTESNHTVPGAALHLWAQTLIRHGSATLSAVWHWSHEQTQALHAHLTSLVAPAPWTLRPLDGTPFDATAVCWDLHPATLCAFLHALRVGAPWHTALNLFAALPDGHFSDDGRVFGTPALRPPPGQPTHYVHLTEPSDPDCLTLFFTSESLVAVCSSHPLLYKHPPGPHHGPDLLGQRP